MAEGPVSLIRELVDGYRLSQAVYVVAKLGVADLIGDERRTVTEIATAAGANEEALYRVMRALAGLGVFHEGDDKVFSLTLAGQLLRSNHPQSQRYSAIYRCEENYDVFRELLMLVVLSGKERRKEEFEALLNRADLELRRVIDTGASFAILEASPV